MCGDRGKQQPVEFLIVLRRQVACQHAPSVCHGACHGLNVKRSGPSTRQATGLPRDLRLEYHQRIV